jgi:WWE domain
MTAHGDGSWQRLTSSGWSSVGESSTLYELAFQSPDHNGTSAVGIYLIDFLNMADITTSYQPIRRLSSKELPEITYEWEESDHGASVWTPYSTDESEAINISSKSGRTKITLYIGHHNTSYEIDLQRQTQLNKLTNTTRWIRSVRPVYFSASPSALSPSNSGVQRQVSANKVGIIVETNSFNTDTSERYS